jgi:hypothetical protein
MRRIAAPPRRFCPAASLGRAAAGGGKGARLWLQHIRGGISVDVVHRGSGLLWATNTGASLWDGARLLADFCSRPGTAAYLAAQAGADDFSWEGKEVVELGCGLGLLSITAALLGARVHATDGDGATVSAARANIAEAATAHGLAHPPRALRLPWGSAQVGWMRHHQMLWRGVPSSCSRALPLSFPRHSCN